MVFDVGPLKCVSRLCPEVPKIRSVRAAFGGMLTCTYDDTRTDAFSALSHARLERNVAATWLEGAAVVSDVASSTRVSSGVASTAVI